MYLGAYCKRAELLVVNWSGRKVDATRRDSPP
jgi:hypothetical protein